MNRIEALKDALDSMEQQEKQLAELDIERSTTLTPDEKKILDEMEARGSVIPVVTEKNEDGTESSIPLSEYAQNIGEHVVEIKDIDEKSSELIKMVNQGDIRKTVDDARIEAREQAIKAFREMATTPKNVSDDDILAINSAALQALQAHFGMERLDSDVLTRKLIKMTMKQIVSILPASFVEVYTKPSEISSNNSKAKERIITTIAYLMATGPELDYLNEYIENEHKLMAISQEIMKCQIDFADMLNSKDKMSEIITKAYKISSPDTTIWSKYIHNDPKRLHNEFAQNAVVCMEYKKAYQELMKKHENDPDAIAMIQEQIDECDNKYAIYTSVTDLTLFKELWAILEDRLRKNKKGSYKWLYKEAGDALERIRKSKQNVPFPIFDAKLVKRPEQFLGAYLDQFPKMLSQYNISINTVNENAPEDDKRQIEASGVGPIIIPGKDETDVLHYFSLLLLIQYGRIMKKLTGANATKYDAIQLDAYFILYCKLGTDIYILREIWDIMKGFVEYAIDTWPRPKNGNRK